MSYKVRIARHVERRINTWGLPDELLVEVHLRLRDRLPQDPTGLLHRTRKPFDGMEYRFALMDLTNRFCEHLCFFHVVYGQNEETLEIVNCGYLRRIGV